MQKEQGKPLALSLCGLTARIFLKWYRYAKCEPDLIGHEHIILLVVVIKKIYEASTTDIFLRDLRFF